MCRIADGTCDGAVIGAAAAGASAAAAGAATAGASLGAADAKLVANASKPASKLALAPKSVGGGCGAVAACGAFVPFVCSRTRSCTAAAAAAAAAAVPGVYAGAAPSATASETSVAKRSPPLGTPPTATPPSLLGAAMSTRTSAAPRAVPPTPGAGRATFLPPKTLRRVLLRRLDDSPSVCCAACRFCERRRESTKAPAIAPKQTSARPMPTPAKTPASEEAAC